MQPVKLDESLEDLIILKEYKYLKSVFWQTNTIFLPLHRDKDHAIELEPGKKDFFGLFYILFEPQFKNLCE